MGSMSILVPPSPWIKTTSSFGFLVVSKFEYSLIDKLRFKGESQKGIGLQFAVETVNTNVNIHATNAPRADHATVRNQFDKTNLLCILIVNPSANFSWQGTWINAVDNQIQMTIKIPAITIVKEVPGGTCHARSTELNASTSIGGPTTIEVSS